jgi:hypothetical protein
MNNNFDNLFLDLNPFAKLNPIPNPNPILNINPIENPNFITNPFANPFVNYFNNNFNDILKTQINKEFRNYIINNFKDKNIYSINDGKLSFKLKKIGNIKVLIDKIINPNKKFLNSLKYQIHKSQLIILIDNIIILMSNKGYSFEFDNYEYILYELEHYNFIDNELCFIKLKTIKQNDNIKKNDNINLNVYTFKQSITNIKSLTWLFHEDNMYEYID